MLIIGYSDFGENVIYISPKIILVLFSISAYNLGSWVCVTLGNSKPKYFHAKVCDKNVLGGAGIFSQHMATRVL